MPWLDLPGRRLDYAWVDPPHAAAAAATSGRPVLVLLHEGLGSIAMWRDFPARLAEHTACRVLLWSRSGHGDSPPPPAPRTARYLHEEALEVTPAVLARLGVTRPLLVGHSDGASIALIHAGAFPGQVAGVVALAPHEFVEARTLEGIRRAGKLHAGSNWSARLARYHRDPDALFRAWHDTWLSPAFRDWNIEACLSAIRCPVLAIQGEDDEYATMRQIERIAECAPDVELLRLAPCGHVPQRDQPEAVLAAIGRLVDRVVTGRAAPSPA